MNIKDPEVRLLAERLAAWRHTSMTDAVRQALSEAIEREEGRREGMVERLMEIAKRAREASDEPYLTDDDLYDERGLPT
ncbi:MAG: type II toxin-antitoxin system VapB family antitoxin [Nocardioides sp.]